MPNQLFNGSICLTDLIEQAKKPHSAFSRASNGKVYFNVAIWVNEQTDQFGNQVSLQLNSKKDCRDKEGKVYIGNAKLSEKPEPAPLTNNDIQSITVDDLPF